jgi:two-component system, OmpR family, response regulator
MNTSILHVEDDASLQNLVRAALEHLGGYVVRTAANGQQALQLARQDPPRLLLLDLDLPGTSGIEVLRELRGIEGLRNVPVIFLTAVVDPRVLAELRALDAQEVLQKPFRPRQLVETVARVLKGSGG